MVAWRTNLELGAARERVRVARSLGTLPVLSEALGRGHVSYAKVRALTRVATPETQSRLLARGRGPRPRWSGSYGAGAGSTAEASVRGGQAARIARAACLPGRGWLGGGPGTADPRGRCGAAARARGGSRDALPAAAQPASRFGAGRGVGDPLPATSRRARDVGRGGAAPSPRPGGAGRAISGGGSRRRHRSLGPGPAGSSGLGRGHTRFPRKRPSGWRAMRAVW